MLQKLRSRGSSKKLDPSQISKTDGTQVHKQPGLSSHSESPFKKNLGVLKRFSLDNDGEDDFLSPKRPKTLVTKQLKKQQVKKAPSKKSSSRKTLNSVLKHTKDNFKNLDVNPEHLQMALALSKSTFAQEYPEEKGDKEDLPSFLNPQKIPKVTTLLEKYGFKYNKNKLNPECSKDLAEAKIPKKSKFRFITPTLYKRTKEERESLINSKVSLIINQQIQTVLINTETLEETNSAELEKYLSNNRCWNLNLTMDTNEFIVESLNLTPSKRTMGCLLKNWDQIAGRDKSPEHHLENTFQNTEKNYQTIKKIDSTATTENSNPRCDNSILENEKRQCLSPDLFDDDDDGLEYTESINTTAKTSNEDHFQDEKLPSSISNSQPVSKINYSLRTSEDIVQATSKSLTKMFKSLSQSSVSSKMTTRTPTMEDFKESSISSKSPLKYRPVSPCISSKSQTKIISSQSSLYTPPKVETVSTNKRSRTISKKDSTETSTYFNITSVSSKVHTEIISTSSFTTIDISQDSSSNDSFKINLEKTNPELSSKFESEAFGSYSGTSSGTSTFAAIEKDSKGIDSTTIGLSHDSFKMNVEKTNPELSSKFESETYDSYSGTSSGTNYFADIETDGKGIEYFESFYDPTEKCVGMKNSFVDLVSSDEDDRPVKTKDISSRNSQEYKEKLVETENAVIESENVNKIDKNWSNRQSLITKHSSLDSGNISFDYNHTKSLNVTDYVMDMLNSQEDTDNGDGVVNQSQSSCSQESIEIVSDEELNYSSRFSAQCKNASLYNLDNFDDCIRTDFIDEDPETVHSKLKNKYNRKNENIAETVEIDNETSTMTTNDIIDKNPSADYKSNPTIEENPLILTPKQIKLNEAVPHTSSNIDTPNNIIIKTSNVTPMLDYDAMDTPNVRKELDKFGIKPVKRRRGVELLKYIYESTHPVVDIDDLVNIHEEENEARPVKKRRNLEDVFDSHKVDGIIKIVGSELIQNENEDDFLFERKFSKKLLSCQIPLQIAWYNFLCCNPGLKENILLYEPIQLEVVHSMIKEQSGCNYHIEELITFLDRKCITFRTIQNKTNKSRKKTKC